MLKQLYDTNKDFKTYVDKYCLMHSLDIEIAFTHMLVKDYAEYVTSQNKLPM